MRVFVEVFEGGEGFFGDVPVAEDFVDGAGGEAGGDEAAHDSVCFLVVGGLFDAFAVEVFAGEGFFVGLAVAGFEGFSDEAGVDAFLLEVLADAADAEFLVFLAESGEGFGEGGVVEVAIVFESGEDGGDGWFAVGAGFDAGFHEAAEVGFGAHLAAEGADGVFEEAGFVEEGSGLGGFAGEGQSQLLTLVFGRRLDDSRFARPCASANSTIAHRTTCDLVQPFNLTRRVSAASVCSSSFTETL